MKREARGMERGSVKREGGTYDLGHLKDGPEAGGEFIIVNEVVRGWEEAAAFGKVPTNADFVW
jgi:hypothetical protein